MRLASDEELEVPIAPLIDVVFLLIIFFVVTTNLQKDVIDYQVQLAKSYFIPPVVDGPPPEALTINVRFEGPNKPALFIVGGSRFSPAQIDRLLRIGKLKYGNELPIIIRSDGRVLYRQIQELNEIIGRVGLYRVSHASEDFSTY